MNSSHMLKKELRSFVKKKAINGKITCATLRKIAEKLGVPYKDAGETANKLKIKIKDCDLGCF